MQICTNRTKNSLKLIDRLSTSGLHHRSRSDNRHNLHLKRGTTTDQEQICWCCCEITRNNNSARCDGVQTKELLTLLVKVFHDRVGHLVEVLEETIRHASQVVWLVKNNSIVVEESK